MYKVTKHGKEIGTGTLTECLGYVATALSQSNPEQVTVKQADDDGYIISRE